MIKVENLTKIYKSEKKDKCVALDSVTFKLEDKGFVFVIGKSGSGKTTLLGLIGGLDNITSGDIIINGISFNSFRYKDFINYRNQMIGYIFQDFHLIDELTVEENIALSLDLQNIKYTNEIDIALNNVGLSGYGKRFPKELSGGEKQRIAIARALVKNPKIILADEPTGNLDSKTTTQILDLLKELSKDRLVLMVSHSLSDANKYADRIIELSSGRIINDYVRNKDYCYDCQIKESKLILPINKKITESELDEINNELSLGNIKSIYQTEDVFISNNNEYKETNELIELKSNRFNLTKLFKLTYTFIKNDFMKLSIYSFVVACLIVILGLAQLIVNFNPSEVIRNELDKVNQNVLSINKKTPSNESVLVIDETRVIDINENDINEFYEAGYNGKIYELINLVLDYGQVQNLSMYHKYEKIDPSLPYYKGSRGTLITDEEYVKTLFGEIEYICLADEVKDYGIYITDYSADAILAYDYNLFTSYESILGIHKSMGVSDYAYINGIIKTGYKEKHKSILEKLNNISLTKNEIQELVESDEYLAYYDEVIQTYSISYTFNPNFKKDFLESFSRKWTTAGNAMLTYNGVSYQLAERTWFQLHSHYKLYNLKDNEIVLDFKQYNTTFGTNYNESNYKDFTPHNATYKYYQFYDEMYANIVTEFEVKIVGLSNGRSYASDDVLKKVLELTTITTSLYFSDVDGIDNLFELVFEKGFEPNSLIAYSLSTMTKAVNIFSDFFNIIFIGLCICGFIILINYGIKLIKERKYEIGILKALGIKDIDLMFIFGSHIMLLLIFIIVLYFLGSVMFIGLSNDILVSSLIELAPNHLLMDIDVLYLKLPLMIKNSILVIGIVLVSFIIPLIKLKSLKPTNIIKAKE